MSIVKKSLYTRWFILLFSLGILILILWNTYLLFQTFKHEERVKMEIWAEANKKISDVSDLDADIELPSNILIKNTTIPVVLTTNNDSIITVSNVPEEAFENKVLQYKILADLQKQNQPIEIKHPSGNQLVYYGNSSLITKLKYYPIALVAILVLFGLLVYSYFRASKMSSENKLWAGMAKETAHQIGTPLSSLMGWIELMKLDNVDENIVTEVQKDVDRLQTIADRFSKIGSEPNLEVLNVVDETKKSFDYLQSRSSKQIDFEFESNADIVNLLINPTLHSWTIENLVKNAIDAIKGKGKIKVELKNTESTIQILVSDTGKGIPKNQFRKVFEPGFSTKKRGWGLGLSLTQRIVEKYHKGSIKVLKSEIGKGTTFSVQYKKSL
ncbi:HAMP domain-containing histidine kinase [Flavobacterium sp. xlx-214]|uniref:sensor histidine kinase n=1 Tax=unclassified Flavobacterium TaxID=196869 RepID=UPI0013D12217|nr:MULTISPECIES: HAMP domain-containing sensor histidine kinase [unclassified Flavobacterium]MBA5792992.1 HAMP domain-containing histidine kinase [Flavobacterium sp. xlx-221]QMI84678.1 HAMP domain-containing histidine kinase [Flavobacterium sp. xlx-214]